MQLHSLSGFTSQSHRKIRSFPKELRLNMYYGKSCYFRYFRYFLEFKRVRLIFASYSLMQWQFWQLTLKWLPGAHADAIYDVNNWMKLIKKDWVFELCDHPFNSIALRCNRFSLQTSIESSNDYMTAMKIFFGDHRICSGFRSISHAFYKIAVLEIIRIRNYCWNCTNCNNNWCKHTHSEVE